MIFKLTYLFDGEERTYNFLPGTAYKNVIRKVVELDEWEPATLINPVGRVIAVGREEIAQLWDDILAGR